MIQRTFPKETRQMARSDQGLCTMAPSLCKRPLSLAQQSQSKEENTGLCGTTKPRCQTPKERNSARHKALSTLRVSAALFTLSRMHGRACPVHQTQDKEIVGSVWPSSSTGLQYQLLGKLRQEGGQMEASLAYSGKPCLKIKTRGLGI